MGLRVFGLTKDIYKREESSGLRQWSFVLGEVLGSLPQIVMVPISFLFGYYFILSPLGSFSAYLVVLLLTQWAVTGVGALIGLLFNPSAASTVNTAVNVVFWACNGVFQHLSEVVIAGMLAIFGANGLDSKRCPDDQPQSARDSIKYAQAG